MTIDAPDEAAVEPTLEEEFARQYWAGFAGPSHAQRVVEDLLARARADAIAADRRALLAEDEETIGVITWAMYGENWFRFQNKPQERVIYFRGLARAALVALRKLRGVE